MSDKNKDLKLDNVLGDKVYENNFEVYFEKFKINKSASQVNFLGDTDLWAIMSTYKTMTTETQKSLIQRAVYKLAKQEHPEWFKKLNFNENESI